MKFYILLALFSFSFMSQASLFCKNVEVQGQKAYQIHNSDTNISIGTRAFANLWDCQKAVQYRVETKYNLVCAPNSVGFSIFQYSQKGIIPVSQYDLADQGTDRSGWKSLDTCISAIKHRGESQRFICAPRRQGSGVYDLYNSRFVGKGNFRSISHCVYATYYSTDQEVCSVSGVPQIVIFNRFHNDISRRYSFKNVNMCVDHLFRN